jgi:hypothetical protein
VTNADDAVRWVDQPLDEAESPPERVADRAEVAG